MMFINFLVWIVSLVMMFVDFSIGWLIAFAVTTVIFMLRFGISGDGFDFDFSDFGDFDGGSD